jgi:hypothetical protein
LEQGEPEQLAPSHVLDAEVTGTGRQRELPASAFLFEMLTMILGWIESNEREFLKQPSGSVILGGMWV